MNYNTEPHEIPQESDNIHRLISDLEEEGFDDQAQRVKLYYNTCVQLVSILEQHAEQIDPIMRDFEKYKDKDYSRATLERKWNVDTSSDSSAQ